MSIGLCSETVRSHYKRQIIPNMYDFQSKSIFTVIFSSQAQSLVIVSNQLATQTIHLSKNDIPDR